MVRIGINGAGRVGRAFLRLAAQPADNEWGYTSRHADLTRLVAS